MAVSMIVAAARNGVIGNNNELLWHLPNDFKFFKSQTSGHPIIMGRKTYESIGRPLPNRTNIVISSDFKSEGVIVVDSLVAAIELAHTIDGDPFIIGGASIYRLAYPLVDRIFLTIVDVELEGDAMFQFPDPQEWELTFQEPHLIDEKHAYNYTFKIFERKA